MPFEILEILLNAGIVQSNGIIKSDSSKKMINIKIEPTLVNGFIIMFFPLLIFL